MSHLIFTFIIDISRLLCRSLYDVWIVLRGHRLADRLFYNQIPGVRFYGGVGQFRPRIGKLPLDITFNMAHNNDQFGSNNELSESYRASASTGSREVKNRITD